MLNHDLAQDYWRAVVGCTATSYETTEIASPIGKFREKVTLVNGGAENRLPFPILVAAVVVSLFISIAV